MDLYGMVRASIAKAWCAIRLHGHGRHVFHMSIFFRSSCPPFSPSLPSVGLLTPLLLLSIILLFCVRLRRSVLFLTRQYETVEISTRGPVPYGQPHNHPDHGRIQHQRRLFQASDVPHIILYAHVLIGAATDLRPRPFSCTFGV